MIAAREPDYWHYFFWIEHIQRFFADNAQHKEPIYFFLLYFPLLAFPWVSLIPAAMSGLRGGTEEKTRPTLHFLWLWFLLPFIFFSLSHGKLWTYILPCFAPLAILMAVGLCRYLSGKDSRLFDFGIIFTALVLAALLTALLIAQNFAIGSRVYEDSEQWRAVLLATALITCIAIAPVAILSTNTRYKLISSLTMFTPLLLVIHFVLPEELWKHKMPEPFFDKYSNIIAKDAVIVSDASMVHAVTWHLKRNDVFLTDKGELRYGLSYEDTSSRLLDGPRFSELLSKTKTAVALICLHQCGPEFTFAFSPYQPKLYKYGEFIMYYAAANSLQTPP